MLRKFHAPISIGLLLLAGLGFAVGFGIAYGWIQRPSKFASTDASVSPPGDSEDGDGLRGPVNRVRTEIATLSLKSGQLIEGPRELLESTTYDRNGYRIDNEYYLVSSSSPLGKEEYAHNDKGDVSELTVRGSDNNILSKEVYAYEYDAVGNWVKMISSTVIYEGGQLTQQPVAVTYRKISYYFDQAIAEIVKTNPSPNSGPADEQSAPGDLASLRGALAGWVAATNAPDLERLMTFYNPRVEAFYLAENVSQKFVRGEKAHSFQRMEALKVSASAPEITISGNQQTATMRFHKEYFYKVKGRERRGEVLQLLRWQRTDDGWKIVGERDLKVIRQS